MKTIIYFFTGTGNSLKVAKDIQKDIGDTQLIRICKESTDHTITDADRIGFIFPVYYYGLPVMVKEFIEKLSIPDKAYIFSIATCGGSVGAAMKQLKQLFLEKDLEISAAFKIQMPDCYQIMYEPPPEKKQKRLFEQQEASMHEVADIIANKRNKKFYEKGKYLTKIFGGLLSKTFKPKKMDKHFWADENCNACLSCVRLCPAENIEMVNQKPVWLQQCELCLGCMQWCPQKAIQYKKGTIKRKRYHHPKIQIKELFTHGGEVNGSEKGE